MIIGLVALLSLVLVHDRRKPNFVIVNMDDMRWDTLEYMPHVMDLLVRKGVMFSNSFVPTSICCPSRGSLLTGKYAHNHGALTVSGGPEPFVGADKSTIATWLDGLGYRTGFYGKYLNSYWKHCNKRQTRCYIPPGWDEWHAFVGPAYYDYKLRENRRTVTYRSDPADYSTDVLARKVCEFIQSPGDAPFFVYLAPFAPHPPSIPANRHIGAFDDIEPWRPPSHNEADVSDKPRWVRRLPLFDPATDGLGDEWREDFLETLLAADDAVAAIVGALEQAGKLDETVIIFTSDNGHHWGEHRWRKKDCEFEECLRVPLVVVAPDALNVPRVEADLVLNIDIAPTVAELAGIVESPEVDGMSLVPFLEKRRTISWRKDFLIEHWADQHPENYVGVRNRRWKYVEIGQADSKENVLYDLERDPYELENRAGDPAHAAMEAELDARLEEIKAETGYK